MFSSRLECLALIAVVHSGIAAIANAQSPQPIPHPCNTMAEAKQFDFWIGVWDVTPWKVAAPTAAQQMGVNDVHAILEHCAVLENWKGARGGEGKSYNYFDPSLRKWRQIWVDDSGSVLELPVSSATARCDSPGGISMRKATGWSSS